MACALSHSCKVDAGNSADAPCPGRGRSGTARWAGRRRHGRDRRRRRPRSSRSWWPSGPGPAPARGSRPRRCGRHRADGPHVVDDGHQVEAGAPDPVAERAAVEVEPLPLEDPGLAVKRKVVAELRDDDPGDQPLGGQPAGHDMLGRMRLRHGLRAAAAGVSGAPRHQHLELRRDHVEPLGDVLADPGHLAAAAGAKRAGRLDHPLDPGRCGRQMPAVALRLAGCLPRAPGQAPPRPSPARPRARPGPVRHLPAAG
jgi:hypothetical protein